MWGEMLRRHAQMSHASCAYCGALPRGNRANSNTSRAAALGIGGRPAECFDHGFYNIRLASVDTTHM